MGGKRSLQQMGRKNTFMPCPPGRAHNWKDSLDAPNKELAQLKKRKKK